VCRWKDNIKIGSKEIEDEDVDWIKFKQAGSSQGTLVGCSKRCLEICVQKRQTISYQLSGNKLHRKDSSPGS
jgi:hypothetical protein